MITIWERKAMKKKSAPSDVPPEIKIKPPRKARHDARLYELSEHDRTCVAACLKD